MRIGALLAVLVICGCGRMPRVPRAVVAHGVFEVVTPKLENPRITYKRPLPIERLPFKQRNDSFHSLGTAFAISPTRFVTAAHVLSWQPSLHGTFALRDGSGAVFLFARIGNYSKYRDLAKAELEAPPPNVRPLELAGTPAVGDPIAAVGNAFAEGIVARWGTVASFTPEPLDGKWSFIRFSAPASPGNSGGPLVDAQGRVVGVVVAKVATSETLNYAVPIGELGALPADK